MNILGLFYNIIQNIINVFKGRRILWHLAAFAATYVLVVSGADWKYFNYFRTSGWGPWLFPAVMLGFFIPILLPLILIIVGYAKKSAKIFYTGFAIAQAAFLGWLISSAYKAVTGRPGPPEHLDSLAHDISRVFNFGFYKGGIFWGWPSSHTTTAFAVGITVAVLFYKHKAVRYLSVIYAAYIGFGVSTNIHWLSDAVAGVIFGTLIGLSVGRAFRKKIETL